MDGLLTQIKIFETYSMKIYFCDFSRNKNSDSLKETKNNFDDYIKSLDTNREIAVTRDEGENFFVVSESYLNSLKESLYIESIPNLKEKILEGINEPIDECLSREELRKQCMS